jgi:hypothetical protein
MAQCTTIFPQMLKLIPRHHFAKLEAEHNTDRKTQSFTRWSQLVHLLSYLVSQCYALHKEVEYFQKVTMSRLLNKG